VVKGKYQQSIVLEHAPAFRIDPPQAILVERSVFPLLRVLDDLSVLGNENRAEFRVGFLQCKPLPYVEEVRQLSVLDVI
jgi:hypothetical protein